MLRARILLADDNPEVLSRVAEILTPRYEVVGSVANGCDLVSETVRTDPDLIVLDFTLPLKDGIQASRESASWDCERSLYSSRLKLIVSLSWLVWRMERRDTS